MKQLLTNEMIIASGNIGTFKPTQHLQSGTLQWENDDFLIYATPNFDKDGEVPVEIIDGENFDSNIITTFTLDYTESPEKQLAIYLAIVGGVIAQVETLNKLR